MEFEELYQKIKKQTVIFFIIALVLLAIIVIHHFFLKDGLAYAGYTFSLICTFGVALFSICFPIFLRLYYFKKVKDNKKGLYIDDYIKFKQLILFSVAFGTLFALEGYFFMIYETLLTVSILLNIYGIYTIIPSKKSMKLELISMKVEGYEAKKKEESET